MGALVLARVAAAEPRLAIEQGLKLLIQQTHAFSSGLFLGRGHAQSARDAQLLWGQGLDQLGLERTREAWIAGTDALSEGEPAWHAQWCVWPLESARGTLLVYVAGAKPLAVEAVARSVVGLAEVFRAAACAEGMAAVSAPRRDQIDWYLAATPPQAVERKQLEVVLNQHEWNLSRVARELGVTRVTVYRKLAKFGIERLRVRKSAVRARA